MRKATLDNPFFNFVLIATAALWFWVITAGWARNGPPSALDTHTHNEHCSPEAHQ